MEAKIYSVSSACFHLNKSNPPQLIISAAGKSIRVAGTMGDWYLGYT